MDRQQQNFFTKEENEAIHNILLKILEKWRTDWSPGEKELEKTVVLSPGYPASTEPSSSSESSALKVSEDALAETVILPPKEGRPVPSSASLTEKSRGHEAFSKKEELPEKEEFLEETVILKPKKVQGKLNE